VPCHSCAGLCLQLFPPWASSCRVRNDLGETQVRGSPQAHPRDHPGSPRLTSAAPDGMGVAALCSPARTGRAMSSRRAPSSAPPNNPPSLSPLFAGPKISQAQNSFPRLTRLVFRRRLPVQHIGVTRGQPHSAAILRPTANFGY
jgi:hypothetical protein